MSARVARRFEGKTAIITGSARGMGKQLALDMVAEGAKVSISDIVPDILEEAKREIEKEKGECLATVCDIADSKQVDDMVKKTVETFGTVHILVNNAGLLTPATIEETTNDLIDRTIGINLKGVLYAIRAVTPIMKKNRYGRIVNVASIVGKRGDNSTTFAYGASKGGVITLTRSTARALGPHGITCNCIAPHAVLTNLMRHWDEKKKKEVAELIPLKRLGTVEDMSYLMMFLASDESSFITGETININGGYYMD
jgi:3-oxoacyl-[acyl-carrier protein] reductase